MKRSLIALLVTACLLAPGLAEAEDGSAGLAFLKLGVGARAIAMGDAYTAVSGDASCLYWNPAGCVDIEDTDIILMHSEWFQGIRYEFAGAVRSECDRAYGVGVVGLFVDDLEERDTASSDPLGTFGVFDFSIAGVYAQRLTGYLSAGASVKYLHEKIDDETARGFAVDLGAQYRLPVLEGATLGLAVQNLGPQMSFIEEKFDLPTMYRFGAAYVTGADALNGDILAVADLVLANDADPKAHFGVEYEYDRTLALRFGYRTGWDNQNISVGLGAKVGDFRLDYAYVPFYSGLGDTHRISFGFIL